MCRDDKQGAAVGCVGGVKKQLFGSCFIISVFASLVTICKYPGQPAVQTKPVPGAPLSKLNPRAEGSGGSLKAGHAPLGGKLY